MFEFVASATAEPFPKKTSKKAAAILDAFVKPYAKILTFSTMKRIYESKSPENCTSAERASPQKKECSAATLANGFTAHPRSSK